ncbi:Zinc finger MYM-type protein 6 [Armadillidium vulgare]|nr:Zinc finger MYM-type protein 6 [Armadillidium vulgare]
MNNSRQKKSSSFKSVMTVSDKAQIASYDGTKYESSHFRRHLFCLSCSDFALQIDESTDNANKALLIIFIRFIDKDQIVNQFLFWKELSVTTKGEDVFNISNNYLPKWQISWKSCVDNCTDGASSMIGCFKGLTSFVKEQNGNVVITYCFLHRETLMTKTLGGKLRKVLNQSVVTLAYLADIFRHLNILNARKRRKYFLTSTDKMKAFQKNYLSIQLKSFR